MSRKPKKRNKPYTGADAAAQKPVVHHYQAVVRSPLNQWWFDNKKRVRIGVLVGAGVLVFAYLMYELLRLVF